MVVLFYFYIIQYPGEEVNIVHKNKQKPLSTFFLLFGEMLVV